MITTHVAEHARVLAELNAHSADGLRDTVLGLVASIGVAVIAVSLLISYGEQRHGKMIGLLLGGSMVLGVAAFPDVTFSVLTGIFSSLFGRG